MHALPPAPAPPPRRQMLVGTALAGAGSLMLIGGMLAVWLMQRDATLEAGETWIPEDVAIPEVPANVMLIAFLGLCVFAQWAVWSARHNDRAHTVFALVITILMALLIINAQAYIYHDMGLVLADGTFVRATDTEHSNLMWAARGGAGGFGVVTALEFDLLPIARVHAGMLAWDCAHAEPVLRDGVVVGVVRSASYGWTLGGAVGLAFVGGDGPVTPQWLADGRWEVDVAGTRHPARVSLRPMYDPTSARVTG